MTMWVYVNGIGIDIQIFVEDEIDREIVEAAMRLASKRRIAAKLKAGGAHRASYVIHKGEITGGGELARAAA